MSGVHDMGGRPNDDPIDQSQHVLSDWERHTHAMVGVLREKRLITTDELRRGIESIPPTSTRGSRTTSGGRRRWRPCWWRRGF